MGRACDTQGTGPDHENSQRTVQVVRAERLPRDTANTGVHAPLKTHATGPHPRRNGMALHASVGAGLKQGSKQGCAPKGPITYKNGSIPPINN